MRRMLCLLLAAALLAAVFSLPAYAAGGFDPNVDGIGGFDYNDVTWLFGQVLSGSAVYTLKDVTWLYHQYRSHQHQFVSTGEVVPPTCTEQGYTVYACTICGARENRDFTAPSHSYAVSETVSPTCTAPGSTTYTCSVCGDSYTETAEALGHDFQFSRSYPQTDGDDGYDLYVCSRCLIGEPRNIQPAAPTGNTVIDAVNDYIRSLGLAVAGGTGTMWGYAVSADTDSLIAAGRQAVAEIIRQSGTALYLQSARCTAVNDLGGMYQIVVSYQYGARY